MPYIRTQVNIPLPRDRETALKEAFGDAISILPGKSEHWLMLEFQEDCRMYFQGNEEPCAFVEVKLFGSAKPMFYQTMTETVTAILQRELSIPAQRIYVQYEECAHWGHNGSNF